MLVVLAASVASAAGAESPPGAIVRNMPPFREQMAARLTFPLSWSAEARPDFAAWRREARACFMEALQAPPPFVDFAPEVVAEEDRGAHLVRKVMLQLTGDSRVPALMTLPKGPGPFPAVLLLHDHGARFDIGKEKLIEPLAAETDRLASARAWVAQGLGGRFIGDELARRGYVCLATDALNWSDRGGAGYEGQQAIASNLLHLGSSFAGLIAWEDLRAAEFLAGRPEVDGRRVAAMGWSMGGFRAWQVAALSDHVAAAVSVCWMAEVKALMTPGNNQGRGQSAFTMLHPGIFRWMDYPDLASIACPKPVYFLAGRQDRLFPADSTEAAFAKMRAVWVAQGAGAHFAAEMWDGPHEFSAGMQDAAFAWLDRELAGGGPARAAPAGGN